MTSSVAALFEDALRQAAGADARPTSITIDYGAERGDAVPVVRAWIERATRSLVFAQVEARYPDGSLAAAGSAVFQRRVDAEASKAVAAR